MDWVTLAAIVLGSLLAMLVLVPLSVLAFSLTPVGKALTERLKIRGTSDDETVAFLCDSVYELREMMDRVGADITSLQDRMESTDRMLTAGAEEDMRMTPH